MIFESNGEPYELKLSDLDISFKVSLENKNIGANTSATDTVNQGTKPKIIDVSGIQRFEEEEHLKKLITLAESVEPNGSRTIYTINERTASLGDIRQVIFHSSFNVSKMGGKEAWKVKFSLMQYSSVAAAKEERQKPKVAAVSDSISGKIIKEKQQPTENDKKFEEEKENTSLLYQGLKFVEKILAPSDENS